jgi:carbon-monoxide dehydrogenase medium subunit
MMRDFELFEPRSISNLLALARRYRDSAKIIAGGTDLLVEMKRGTSAPATLISIRTVSGLKRISYRPRDGLRLGAATTIHEIETSPILREHYPVLAQAASRLGSPQVRNQATVGGNVCQASPAGDIIPPLMALGASLVLRSTSGERSMPIEDFFRGPGETLLKPGEVLTEISIPPPEPKARSAFLKHGRREGVDLAIVNVAVWIHLKENHACEEARLALGAVAPTVIRARSAESLMRGKRLNDDVIRKVGERASEEVQPISDLRASAEYRSEMSRVITVRALRAALADLRR